MVRRSRPNASLKGSRHNPGAPPFKASPPLIFAWRRVAPCRAPLSSPSCPLFGLRARVRIMTTRTGAFRIARRALVHAAAAGAFVGACTKQGCDIGGLLRQRAGSGALDCGHATEPAASTPVKDAGAPRSDAGLGDAGTMDTGNANRASVEAVDACVTAAFRDKLAFFAQYDRPEAGPGVVAGIAADSTGRVFLLGYFPQSGVRNAESARVDACNEPSVNTSEDRDPNRATPIRCRSTSIVGLYCSGGR
jgi:hypothetical protein